MHKAATTAMVTLAAVGTACAVAYETFCQTAAQKRR